MEGEEKKEELVKDSSPTESAFFYCRHKSRTRIISSNMVTEGEKIENHARKKSAFFYEKK